MDYKSVHHTIYLFLLSLLLLLRSAIGQTITLDYFIQSGSCTNGDLLENNDFLILNGTVDLESASPAEWKLDIPIQYQVQSTFETICTVRMINSCTNDGTNCYCTSQSGTKYNFIFNSTATSIYRRATMRAELSRYDARGSKNATVVIPDVIGMEVSSLTMNSSALDLESCVKTLKKNVQYSFAFCATNLKNPKLSIQFGTTIVDEESAQCINRTTTTPADLTSLNYTFKYSDECQRSKTFTCLIIETSGSEDNTAPIVGGAVGGSCLLIICIVVGVLIYKKAKKRPTDLTLTETTPTKHTHPARHIETKRPLPPLAHLPPHKISPDISGNNEKASNITDKTSNETPNDSQRKKKPRKKRARRNLENGGKNDEQ